MSEPKRVIPDHIGKLMSPEDQKKYGFKTVEQTIYETEFKLEKELHDFFISFLNRQKLGYYHADPTRKSTIALGMPDFGIYRNSRIVWIEFKIGKNKLEPHQKDKIATMLTDGNAVQVCYDYMSAVNVVGKFFELEL